MKEYYYDKPLKTGTIIIGGISHFMLEYGVVVRCRRNKKTDFYYDCILCYANKNKCEYRAATWPEPNGLGVILYYNDENIDERLVQRLKKLGDEYFKKPKKEPRSNVIKRIFENYIDNLEII